MAGAWIDIIGRSALGVTGAAIDASEASISEPHGAAGGD
jgi:hypothetical protein